MIYTPNPQHRSRAFAGIKSQWTISLPEEKGCFDLAASADWFGNDCYWGLNVGGGSVQPIGMAPPPIGCPLHVAKFVGDSHENWHGYPVAHWIAPWDRPTEVILISWKVYGFISKAQMAKIHRGKKCAL